MSTHAAKSIVGTTPVTGANRRIVAAAVLNVLLVAAATASVNYGIDAAGYFRSKYAERQRLEYTRAVAHTLQTPGATCSAGVHDRIALIAFYLRLVDPAQIEVIHLGSSLQLPADGDFVSGGRGYVNACGAGTFLPQMVGMYELVREQGVRPKRVIIGADAWNFTHLLPIERHARELQPWIKSGYQRLHRNVDPGFEALLAKEKDSLAQLGGLRRLFDMDYARTNLKLWFENRSAPDNTEDDTVTYTSDLSIIRWPTALQDKDRLARYPLGALKSTICEPRFDEFNAVLDLIAADGADCELVLSPINPAYPVEDEVLEMRRQIEVRLRKIAAARGLLVRGSYNAQTVGLFAADFIDYGHPHRDAYQRIFEYIAARDP